MLEPETTEPAQAQPDTVDSASSNTSAISAAVKRNLRKAMIASTRPAGVRLATCRGAEERS